MDHKKKLKDLILRTYFGYTPDLHKLLFYLTVFAVIWGTYVIQYSKFNFMVLLLMITTYTIPQTMCHLKSLPVVFVVISIKIS